MSTDIYYFSGTGNSLVVARNIAAQTGGKLIPIASVPEREAVRTDATGIGIVFPNYNAELPPLVKRFAEKLEGIGDKYVFAVCTYGHGYGRTHEILKQILRERGGRLSAWYGIHMPQSAFCKPWENHQRIYKTMRKRAETIARNTNRCNKGRFVSSIVFHLLNLPLVTLFRPMIKKSYMGHTGLPKGSSMEELMYAADMNNSVNETCNACGICARVCPVNNIAIAAGKPVWLHHCENCLACINWCPKEAIQSKIVQKGYHYRHPDARAADFMAREKIS